MYTVCPCSKSYGKGRRTVVVASKVPLPNFRPDLEAHREERQVAHGLLWGGRREGRRCGWLWWWAHGTACRFSAVCFQVEMDSHIQSVVASALQPEGQSTSSRAPTAPVNTPDAAFSSRPQPRNRNIDYPGMAKPKMSMESWEEMSDAGAEDKDDVAAQVHQPLLAPGDSVQCVPRANVPKQPCGSLQQEGKRLREQQERAMQSPKVHPHCIQLHRFTGTKATLPVASEVCRQILAQPQFENLLLHGCQPLRRG